MDEGIGLRYDPYFNTLAAARPVVDRAAARLMRGLADREVKAKLTDWTVEAAQAMRTLRTLLHRVERDELRVRSHPRDTVELQRFLSQQVRRALLAAGALTVAIVASIVFAATRRLEVLVAGLVVSLGLFFLIFVLPSHLFQNPLRFRRRGFGR